MCMQVSPKEVQRLLALSKLAILAAVPETLNPRSHPGAHTVQHAAGLRLRDQRLALLLIQVGAPADPGSLQRARGEGLYR